MVFDQSIAQANKESKRSPETSTIQQRSILEEDNDDVNEISKLIQEKDSEGEDQASKTSTHESEASSIQIAAIDNGLAFPFKHPDEWRACKTRSFFLAQLGL